MNPDILKDYGSGVACFYGVFQNNSWVTHEFVSGTISKNSNELVNMDTRFDIASLTKTFTAVLVHMAVDEKRFFYHTKITEIDSNFKNLKNISIEDLLCHRQEIWTVGYLGSARSKEEWNQILYSAYIKSPNPKYVDTHYIILSKVLEKIYQKNLEEIMEEKIFKPLNLANTSYRTKKEDSLASCDGEQLNETIISVPIGEIHDKKARESVKMSIYPGHAGLFSTAKDLFEFLKSLIDQNKFLMKEETINHFFDHDDYDAYLKKCYENQIESIISPYTFGGMRYKIKDKERNPVRVSCSWDAYLFSGYTGPLYFIDRSRKIIIVVMINSVHESRKTRQERLNAGINIVEEIYKSLKKEFFEK